MDGEKECTPMKPKFRFGKIGNALFSLTIGLACFFLTGATAPRFAPEWFKQDAEVLPVVVFHEYPPYRSVSIEGGGLHARIVSAVFAAAGIDVVVDIQPAKSLVIYALSQAGTAAVVGEESDFRNVSREELVFVPFHLKTGRYFYYRPAYTEGSTWSGNLESLRGSVLGLERSSDVEAYESAGITVKLGEPKDLLDGLVTGEIDFLGSDADRLEWLIQERMPENAERFAAMEIPAWESFSFVVFNTAHKDAAMYAGRFIDTLKRLLENRGYDLILKAEGRNDVLPPTQRRKLIKYLDSLTLPGGRHGDPD
jgi:polar amino acid transport system substrate-binding protein